VVGPLLTWSLMLETMVGTRFNQPTSQMRNLRLRTVKECVQGHIPAMWLKKRFRSQRQVKESGALCCLSKHGHLHCPLLTAGLAMGWPLLNGTVVVPRGQSSDLNALTPGRALICLSEFLAPDCCLSTKAEGREIEFLRIFRFLHSNTRSWHFSAGQGGLPTGWSLLKPSWGTTSSTGHPEWFHDSDGAQGTVAESFCKTVSPRVKKIWMGVVSCTWLVKTRSHWNVAGS
jgi:hypothetical protein